MVCYLYNILPVNKKSLPGIKRLSSAERKLINIPDKVRDILVGILLGDAHIVQRSSSSKKMVSICSNSSKA